MNAPRMKLVRADHVAAARPSRVMMAMAARTIRATQRLDVCIKQMPRVATTAMCVRKTMFARTVHVPEKRKLVWMAIRARQIFVTRKPGASTNLSPIAEQVEWGAARAARVRILRVARALPAAVMEVWVVKTRRMAAVAVRLTMTEIAIVEWSTRAKIEIPMLRFC